MGDWTRVIGALRRLRGSLTAERAGRVAEAAPGADRFYTDEAIQELFAVPEGRGVVGVGPGSLYNHYVPWHPEEGPERQVENLRRLLARPDFGGFREVPWFNLEREPLGVRVNEQEGRHRSATLGPRQSLVGIYPDAGTSLEDLRQAPVGVDRYRLGRSPWLDTEWEDPLRYQLFSQGGSVG